ncbi:inosose dehydratase [Azospirillum lipoferum]|uniref:Myo-inosose-2 dehydratase n=1 Tax=Azospirillum lipoferum TaxID=193 RepID=A0A5A9G9C5_AZOLI|nr:MULTISPECIES: myo-inosose-2 dehydratase [Azospirillum]KAA0590314.1 myo-inosose-2 dehydratase [Azospirillum lipoferum]MCP1614929.1 inosose dehydratase [Azospirillum lipoferum]MDW5532525.1 myo-inosose-2 dehydratase [Azospirillum sp. NL1]
MTVRLGVNPIAWSNDDMPELGGATPLEQCLAEGREAGFQGFELGNKFPRDAAALRPILDSHGLSLVSGWYSAGLLERSVAEEIEAVQPHLRLLKAMGCPVMVVAETTGCVHGARGTPLSRRPKLEAGQWAEFGRRMAEFGDYLRDQGTPLAYHYHMGTVVETPDEIDVFAEVTGDSVGILLDTGHLTFAGGNLLDVIAKWGPRINHVHCKDVRADVLKRAKATDSSFLDAVIDGVFTVPGDGCVDFPAVLKALKDADYRGQWLVIEAEQDPAKAHPLTYVTKGRQHLSALVAEYGL